MLHHSGFSAYLVASAPITVNLHSRRNGIADLDFVRNTSLSGQFTFQGAMRVTSQKELLKETGNSKSRRISDCDQTPKSVGVSVGDSAISYERISRKSAPKWRGLAIILDIGEAGATAKFRSQTLTIA